MRGAAGEGGARWARAGEAADGSPLRAHLLEVALDLRKQRRVGRRDDCAKHADGVATVEVDLRVHVLCERRAHYDHLLRPRLELLEHEVDQPAHRLVLLHQQLRHAEEDLSGLKLGQLFALREEPQDARQDARALPRVDLPVVEAAALLQHRALLQAGERAVHLVLVLVLARRHAHGGVTHALHVRMGKAGTRSAHARACVACLLAEDHGQSALANTGKKGRAKGPVRGWLTCSHCAPCEAMSAVDELCGVLADMTAHALAHTHTRRSQGSRKSPCRKALRRLSWHCKSSEKVGRRPPQCFNRTCTIVLSG